MVKHECVGTDEYTFIFWRESGEYWVLIPDTLIDVVLERPSTTGVPIDYCPFCGLKLPDNPVVEMEDRK